MSIVTREDVENSKHRMDELFSKWYKQGGLNVTQHDINQSAGRIQQYEYFLHDNKPSRHCTTLPKIAFNTLLAVIIYFYNKIGYDEYKYWKSATLGVCLWSTCMVVSVQFTSLLKIIHGTSLLFFMIGFLLGQWFSLPTTLPAVLSRRRWLIEFRNRRIDAIKYYRKSLSEERKTKEDLEFNMRIRLSFEEAKKSYDKLLAQYNSRKNQLKLRNWRDLRDIEFEQFLKEVFESLGYTVQTTKRSWDKGVDLIVGISANLVAIQVKGWKNSVGKEAVDEVLNGMSHYGCHRCVVITNSRFGDSAVLYAEQKGCKLVAGHDIENLIDGRIAI